MLIAALGRIVQSQAIVEPALHYPRDVSSSAYSPGSLPFSELEPLDGEGRTFRNVASELAQMCELRLDGDVVFACPWRPQRLMMSLSKLRPRGGWSRWKQDNNHQVCCGSPSASGSYTEATTPISAGILTASGMVTPDFGYNLTPFYDHVVCNGRKFRRRHDKGVITDVSSIEIAAIFEMGRLMVEVSNQQRGDQ